jgi:hypothetical protein
MEDSRAPLRFTAYDISKFDTIEELMVFDQVYSQLTNDQWVHSIESRKLICSRIGIAEITCKVFLRSLLNKGALIKNKKAVYNVNLNYVTKQG